jgi:hypothetical protein
MIYIPNVWLKSCPKQHVLWVWREYEIYAKGPFTLDYFLSSFFIFRITITYDSKQFLSYRITIVYGSKKMFDEGDECIHGAWMTYQLHEYSYVDTF